MAAKTTKISIRLSEEEKSRLQKVAECKDIPIAQLVRELIRVGLKEVNR